MVNYTNAELADMHLVYGAADCNGPAAQYTETISDEEYSQPEFLCKAVPEVSFISNSYQGWIKNSTNSDC